MVLIYQILVRLPEEKSKTTLKINKTRLGNGHKERSKHIFTGIFPKTFF